MALQYWGTLLEARARLRARARVCVCSCVRACVRACRARVPFVCVRACVRARARVLFLFLLHGCATGASLEEPEHFCAQGLVTLIIWQAAGWASITVRGSPWLVHESAPPVLEQRADLLVPRALVVDGVILPRHSLVLCVAEPVCQRRGGGCHEVRW
jgi:hypothetical protein